MTTDSNYLNNLIKNHYFGYDKADNVIELLKEIGKVRYGYSGGHLSKLIREYIYYPNYNPTYLISTKDKNQYMYKLYLELVSNYPNSLLSSNLDLNNEKSILFLNNCIRFFEINLSFSAYSDNIPITSFVWLNYEEKYKKVNENINNIICNLERERDVIKDKIEYENMNSSVLLVYQEKINIIKLLLN